VPGEEVLSGGGLSHVVKMGATVRRPVGPWTPPVHALLVHLERVGFDGSPRVLGIDDCGREILSFVFGEARAVVDDAALAAVARLARRLHDATVGFEAPADAQWQFLVGAPREGDVICHNDLSPWNTGFLENTPRAFLDWDLAAPGPRLWELGHAVWRFVPLFPGEDVTSCGRRLRVFCDGYGLDDRGELLEFVRRRQQALYETAREWGREGRVGWADVWRDKRGEQWLASRRFLEENHAEFERALAN
jgi:aminoglycoside phosphotransferase (APT) family kinase protein